MAFSEDKRKTFAVQPRLDCIGKSRPGVPPRAFHPGCFAPVPTGPGELRARRGIRRFGQYGGRSTRKAHHAFIFLNLTDKKESKTYTISQLIEVEIK